MNEQERARRIRDITPPDMGPLGERLIREGVSVEVARKRLLAAHEAVAPEAYTLPRLAVANVSNQQMLTSLCGPGVTLRNDEAAENTGPRERLNI